MKVEIMDTTLRDGEQTSEVAYTPIEKLHVAKLLLEELKVDRIEVASARVSEGEFQAVKKITDWAREKNLLDRVEVLGFIDGKQSLDWIYNAGARVVNLLSKGSLNHLTHQLRKTLDEHIADITSSVNYAQSLGISCNLYLEDWSNGMRNSKEYVLEMIDKLKVLPIKRFMLPDTLGILNPDETFDYCKQLTEKYPELNFDFHPHNDYDLAVANVYFAIKAGIKGIHTTVNGLGERAGNAPLSSVIAVLADRLKCEISIDESKIMKVSQIVESFSGIRIPANKPIIGDNVFTQACGVHADGDNKKNLYFNELLPERFGRIRKYAIGKTSGKASVLKNLEELGIELDAEALKKVTEKIIELGDRKELITQEDLPYIIDDVLHSQLIEEKIKVINYTLQSANGLRSSATVKLQVNGEQYEETSSGDGQYDAFMNVLKMIYQKLGKQIPKLVDYNVTIPPGGRTDALVEAKIKWEDNEQEMKTKGLDPDQNVSAIKATLRMLNLIEMKRPDNAAI
jgi:(R)-citramalate synthase